MRAIACLLALTLASCRTPTPTPQLPPAGEPAASASGTGAAATPPTAPAATAAVAVATLGRSLDGEPIVATLVGDAGANSVLFLATIHGNEWAGTRLLELLAEHLRAMPDDLHGRRAIIVPLANPDGRAHGSRHNRRGVDLNRNFPSPTFTASPGHGPSALSEPESRAIHAALLDHRPARVVSIHQPWGVIDFDGPAEALAYAMAARCDLPVQRVGARPGSLGSFAGDTLGLAVVTVELRRDDHRLTADDLWQRYGEMLLAALRDLP